MGDTFLGLPPAAALAVAAVLGACCGSFSNVLIHRLPRNLGVVRGRSFCPSCERRIAWYDNVPVLSWLFLRGRCRHCGARMPFFGVRQVKLELLEQVRYAQPGSALFVQRVLEKNRFRQCNVLD